MPSPAHQDQLPRKMALPSLLNDQTASFEDASAFHHKATLAAAPKPELGIRHFISRGNGILVPVIPLDELPLELHGVPNHLLWEDTRSMTFLGELPSTGATYAISEIKDSAFGASGNSIVRHGRGFASLAQDSKMPEKMEAFQLEWRNACAAAEWDADPNPDHDEDFNELARVLTDEEDKESTTSFPFSIPATPGLSPQAPKPDLTKVQQRPRSSDMTSTNAPEKPPINAVPSSRPLPPSGVEPDETRKEFCSYWIRTGECAFTQQGCKYKHEMPPDRLTLKRVFGIDQWPKWWIERFPNDSRVLAMYPNPHRPAGKDFMSARSWRTAGPKQPAVSPITAFSSLAAAARAHPRQKGGDSGRGRRDTPSPPKGHGQKGSGKSRGPVDPVASKMAAILHDPFRSPRSSRAPSVAGTDLIDLESNYGRLSMSRSQSTASTTINATTTDARPSAPQKIEFPRLFDDRPEPKTSQKQPKQSSKKSSKQSSKQSSSTSEVFSSESPRKRVDDDDDGDDESGVASGSTGSMGLPGFEGRLIAVKDVAATVGEKKKKSKKNHGATRHRRKARELLAMTKAGNEGGETARAFMEENSSSDKQKDVVNKGKEKKEQGLGESMWKSHQDKDDDLKGRSLSTDKQRDDAKKGKEKAENSSIAEKQRDDEEKKDVQKENIPPKEQ